MHGRHEPGSDVSIALILATVDWLRLDTTVHTALHAQLEDASMQLRIFLFHGNHIIAANNPTHTIIMDVPWSSATSRFQRPATKTQTNHHPVYGFATRAQFHSSLSRRHETKLRSPRRLDYCKCSPFPCKHVVSSQARFSPYEGENTAKGGENRSSPRKGKERKHGLKHLRKRKKEKGQCHGQMRSEQRHVEALRCHATHQDFC